CYFIIKRLGLTSFYYPNIQNALQAFLFNFSKIVVEPHFLSTTHFRWPTRRPTHQNRSKPLCPHHGRATILKRFHLLISWRQDAMESTRFHFFDRYQHAAPWLFPIRE